MSKENEYTIPEENFQILLSYDSIGENNFESFKFSQKLTDFSILMGNLVTKDVVYKFGSCWKRTEPSSKDGKQYVISGDFEEPVHKKNVGLQVCIPIEELKDVPWKKVSNGYECEAYLFPQYAVSKELQKKLNEEYEKNTLDRFLWNFPFEEIYEDPTFITSDAVIYKNKYYIRVKSNQHKYNQEMLNGIMCYPNDLVWIEMSPVKFYIPVYRSGSLSSVAYTKNILLGNVFVNTVDRKENNIFTETDLYRVLNHQFKDCLKQMKIKKNIITPNEYTIVYNKLMEAYHMVMDCDFDSVKISKILCDNTLSKIWECSHELFLFSMDIFNILQIRINFDQNDYMNFSYNELLDIAKEQENFIYRMKLLKIHYPIKPLK